MFTQFQFYFLEHGLRSCTNQTTDPTDPCACLNLLVSIVDIRTDCNTDVLQINRLVH